MNQWAASLRLQQDGTDPQYPTLLETYVSFVLMHKGKRWETGQGADQHGHWISNQLVHFKIALKKLSAFSRVAMSY